MNGRPFRIGATRLFEPEDGIASARLQEVNPDYGCSNATLKGEYAFGVTAYTPSGLPTGPPQVVAGIKVFDGNGNLTQRDYIGGSSPADFSMGETGFYTVNSDCTGSLVINVPVPHLSTGVIKVLIVISDGGRHIHEVVSELIPPGANGIPSVPTNTSTDDWKVASEQEH